MAKHVLVVTNCTTRKRRAEVAASLPTCELRGTPSTIARRWVARLHRRPALTSAGELYVGRAFFESKRVAALLNADLCVVSAGLGLVRHTDLVPSYNLTVASGAGSIKQALSSANAEAADWWQALSALRGGANPLSRLVRELQDGVVLLALPASYVAMISRDLADLEAASAGSLRIITSEMGRAKVPPHLAEYIVPYDERLEGSPGYAGTRADFPQRALRHFVEEVGGHLRPIREAKAAVAEALSRLSKPTIPLRAKKSDEEIIQILRANWLRCAGGSARLHRYLRDEALVACEQTRFRNLWRQVQTGG